ncbi:hypothetical protein QYH69_33990 [Paraburkholderia sp. SARCC-3016]|uniref:hypothetical protein n=1 Tax=Paraburkholderia sp. SARCC-3016 TaxID=3058611 RepID=UPI002807E669|nr:hypothetical protein [Paraburkholderia sp. SARCC-3016]MDQ7982237.1 hypothetical protein [Paraburkholderia sp. SARCC-3016]
MIEFRPLRTKRLALKLQEIAIGDAISLAAIPPSMYESQTTRFLTSVIKEAEAATPNHVTDPRAMTVQERGFVVAHYMAHVSETAPDFMIGAGRFSNYLVGQQQNVVPTFPAGDVGGDAWSLVPLIGAAAESIEELHGDLLGISGEYHWMLGCMASQLRKAGDTPPDPVTDTGYGDWLRDRMFVFHRYPESDFIQMLVMYREAVRKTRHFFNMDINGDGVIFLEEVEKEAVATLPPARFPVSSCLSDFSLRMGGKTPAVGE